MTDTEQMAAHLAEASSYVIEAQRILSKHLEPGGPSAVQAIKKLIVLFDNEAIITRQKQWLDAVNKAGAKS